MEQNKIYSSKRYFVAFFLIFAQFSRALVITAFSPLFTTIKAELDVSSASASSLVSVVNIGLLIFLFVGNGVASKFGLKNAFGIGILLIGLGDALAFISGSSFILLFISRALVGVGTGMFTPCVGGLNMQWFPPEEKGIVSALTSAFAFGGTYVAYALTIPLFNLFGKWTTALGIYGAVIFVISIFWMLFGSENKKYFEAMEEERKAAAETAKETPQIKPRSNLAIAFERREIKLLMVIYFFIYFAYTALTSYLPSFFQIVRGMDAAAASNLTSIFPLVGLIAGILAGVLCKAIGLRKGLMLPAMILMFACAIGSLTIDPSNAILPFVVGAMGFGSATHNSLWMGVTMEMDGSNPSIVSGAYTLVFACGYGASILSPMVYGWLVDSMGPQKVLIGCSIMIALGAVLTVFLPETGARKKNK